MLETVAITLMAGVAAGALLARLGWRRPAPARSRAAGGAEAPASVGFERFAAYAPASEDWLWETDAEHRFSFISARRHDVIGFDPAGRIGRRREELPGAEADAASWRALYDDLEARRPFRNFIYAIRRVDGTTRRVSVSGRPVVGENGVFLGYRGTAREVSADVARESAAARMVGQLQALIDSLPMGLVLIDRALNTVAFNRTFADAYREDFSASSGDGSASAAPPAAGEPFARFVRSAAKRGLYGKGDVDAQVEARLAELARHKPFQTQFSRPDGRVTEARGQPIGDGLYVLTYLDVTKRKLAQRALRDSEARFRDFAEAASDWLWEQDSALRFTYVSAKAYEPYGLAAEDLLGRRLDELNSVSIDVGEWRAHLGYTAAQSPFRDLRFTLKDASGRERWISLSGRPVIDSHGEFCGYRGTGTDITARVEAEASAQLAQRRLADAIDSLDDGLALFDANDRLVLFNRAYANMAENPDAEVRIGMTFEEILRTVIPAGSGEQAQAAREAWIQWRIERHARPEGPFERQMPNGTWRQVREQRLPDGGTILVSSDITNRRARETEVAEKKTLLQATLEHMGEGIALTDADLRLRIWNDRFIDLLDLPRELVYPGADWVEIVRWQVRKGEFGSVDVEAEVARRTEMLRQPRPTMVERQRPNGRYLEIRRNPIPGGGFVSIYADITERKRVESTLRNAKETAELAARTKAEFLANMSHELRTPLNAIIGFSEIISQELFGNLGSPKYKDYARDIFDSGAHLLALINDILDVSKADAGKIDLAESTVDVGSVITDSLRLVRPRAQEGDVTLVVPPTDSLPRLRADARRLKQVLLNLLSNAVKFTPAGGRVGVDAVRNADREFVIRVWDTGIGIAPEDIPRALAPFGQVDNVLARRHEGTGLGLSLSKLLVELHGGRLEIQSAVGKGTTVLVVLPAARVIEPPLLGLGAPGSEAAE